MGARNVGRAYAYWRCLPHAPFRLLVFMAYLSLDADEPPRFFGGTEAMAEAVGRDLPLTRTHRVAVSDLVGQLVRAGAISRHVQPAKGRRAEYVLHLDGPERSGLTPDERLGLSLTTVRAEPDNGQGSPLPQGVGGGLGTGGGTTSPEVSASPAGDAPTIELTPTAQGEPGPPCPACGGPIEPIRESAGLTCLRCYRTRAAGPVQGVPAPPGWRDRIGAAQ